MASRSHCWRSEPLPLTAVARRESWENQPEKQESDAEPPITSSQEDKRLVRRNALHESRKSGAIGSSRRRGDSGSPAVLRFLTLALVERTHEIQLPGTPLPSPGNRLPHPTVWRPYPWPKHQRRSYSSPPAATAAVVRAHLELLTSSSPSHGGRTARIALRGAARWIDARTTVSGWNAQLFDHTSPATLGAYGLLVSSHQQLEFLPTFRTYVLVDRHLFLTPLYDRRQHNRLVAL